MELSKNITISNGIFEGERRIRLHYRMEPKTKNISFSVNEWILLLALLEEIKRFFSRVLTEDAPTEKTWDLIPEGRGGNKRVTVKRFESGTTIIDFRIFNFHVKPELPTKYGVSLNKSEWEQFLVFSKQINEDWVNQENMRSAIKAVLRDMVLEKTKSKCHGCIIDHPSQKQHMENGCLSSWEWQRNTYMEECFHTIAMDRVLERYTAMTGEDPEAWKKLKLIFEEKTFKDDCMLLNFLN